MKGIFVLLFAVGMLTAEFPSSFAVASEAVDAEFTPADPTSEFLPAAQGEPPIDFCSEWNPEFGYRGYRCCSNGAVSRGLAAAPRGRRGRRVANGCAPNRKKSTFCDEMTGPQREYIAGVKAGRIDVLENIQKSIGSHGGQAFCSAGNGFLVEGRPLVPTENNRIELRNEARCANFGTDPLVGALEWAGREVKREYHEPEFKEARLIIGDIAAPRGGCISGRGGRRAHKSHTSGVDIDLAYFNPRASHQPEERFTRTFYVASNWWFLKKLFKNPVSCVKIIFVDRGHIRELERYAKDDPEWPKLKRFVRHVRGHRDHFHIRFGSGPGAPGCSGNPDLEEDEDQSDEAAEGFMVKEDSASENSETYAAEEGTDAVDPSAARSVASTAVPAAQISTLRNPAATVEGPSLTAVASETPVVDSKTAGNEAMKTLASGVVIAQTTLPPHKQEPTITLKYAEKSHGRKRSGRRTASNGHRSKKRK